MPLWSTAGGAASGAFVESLTLSGSPEAEAPRRTLVQSRQIFAFCEAARRGWLSDGSELARAGFEQLLKSNRAPGGGWAHAVDVAGRPADERPQLYDQAFVLFALAHAHAVLGDPRARAEADATLRFLDDRLASPRHGGFQEDLVASLPRRSNSHMHLLEAWLAWLEATGEPEFADRAQAIVRLFEQAFFDPAQGVLTEFFQTDWRPAERPDGEAVEPGHLYEWCWLLAWAERLGLNVPEGAGDRLFHFAEHHGRDAAGFVVDGCDRAGRVTVATRRLWPQTERIKALVARARQGDEGAASAAAVHAEAVLDSYLAGPVAGGWIDRFDAHGRPAVDRIPASSFYHVTLAFSELQSLADEAGRDHAM